jgi:hypothetical protein
MSFILVASSLQHTLLQHRLWRGSTDTASQGCWLQPVRCQARGTTARVSPSVSRPGPLGTAFQPKNTACVQDLRWSDHPRTLPDLVQQQVGGGGGINQWPRTPEGSAEQSCSDLRQLVLAKAKQQHCCFSGAQSTLVFPPHMRRAVHTSCAHLTSPRVCSGSSPSAPLDWSMVVTLHRLQGLTKSNRTPSPAPSAEATVASKPSMTCVTNGRCINILGDIAGYSKWCAHHCAALPRCHPPSRVHPLR